MLSTVWDHGLAESDAGIPQLLKLFFAQLGVTLLHKVQRLIHPDELILLVRLDYAALLNRTEQLIASPIQGRLGTSLGPTTNPSLSGQSLLRVWVVFHHNGTAPLRPARGPFSLRLASKSNGFGPA
jgi:hypothetical protein